MAEDRLDNFGVYKLACQLFDDFWNDLDQIIGGLTTTINTIESKRTK